ncbi:hypothetical protein EYE40_11400 [Glaciihabitans arcticus]|uniref:Uncharacterized protein n=1 Tax=Glaciihabitans arcticus TaxID=2668039 RepID=A0A4Q9GTF5_9MICO|nr:DUF6609 family protein [Glaciihabitans arcticus]TBN57955.1 hypothetical protein EYE40_11400 [Glaciihabitans arcticus]
MDLFTNMPEYFPLMRGGGAFLALIGLGIVVGAFGGRRWRLVLLIVGAGLGIAAMAVGGATRVIFAGLPYPAIWQWVVLGAAFAIEMLLVNIVLRKVPDVTSHAFWMWILFIVGAHFLVLGASHGPICAVLAVACMINALIGLRFPAVDLRVFWAVDGVLKITAGVTMVVVSYS